MPLHGPEHPELADLSLMTKLNFNAIFTVLTLRGVEGEEKPKATAKKRQGLVVKEGYTKC